MTLPLTGTEFFHLPPISSEQIIDLTTSNINLKPQTMQKIYTSLFSAIHSISEAFQLQLFPVREKFNGLSQMQPLLVPRTFKK